MVDFEKPTNNEVNRWALEVVRHSFHVEYYLNKLELGQNDPERPHDLFGEYDKLDWDVLRGISLSYRDKTKDFFEEQILPSIELHRKQHHHRMWNNYNPNATMEDHLVGAVDATCTLLEKRIYSGGKEERLKGREHNWGEALTELRKNKEDYKVQAAELIVPEMQKIEKPNLELITTLSNIPNIGVPKDTYRKIKERVREAAVNLKFRGYNILG